MRRFLLFPDSSSVRGAPGKHRLSGIAGPALLRHSGPQAGSADLPVMPKPLPLGATATTAASGGNREELLGQRPAGCKRQRSRRWVPQPGLGAKRLKGHQQCPNPQLGQWHSAQPRHRPPSPRRAMSSAVMGSSASRRGSSRSKMVRLAYMTQPGRPQTGTLPR